MNQHVKYRYLLLVRYILPDHRFHHRWGNELYPAVADAMSDTIVPRTVDVVFYQGFVMVRIISTTSQFSVSGTDSCFFDI